MNELKDAMQFLEKGLLTAFLAGVVIGVLALLLGDYIIILFTSVSGAMLVVSMADRIYELPDQTYNIALGVLALIGLLLQCIHKWDRKNVKKDKKEKKERRR
jgi:membrane protein implicated in regulation of membrane protease activity